MYSTNIDKLIVTYFFGLKRYFCDLLTNLVLFDHKRIIYNVEKITFYLQSWLCLCVSFIFAIPFYPFSVILLVKSRTERMIHNDDY